MANQVKTVFSVDTGKAIRAIDEYEKRLRLVASLESKIGSGAGSASASRSRALPQQDEHVRAFKAAEKDAAKQTKILEQEAAKAEKIRARELKAAEKDAARYAKERERMERELTKQIERETRHRERIQEKEQQRRHNDMLASLGGPNSPGGAQGGFWGSVATQLGVTPSTIAGVTAATAAWVGLSVAVSKVSEYYKELSDRAIGVERSNRLLTSSAREAGVGFGDLTKLNRRFGEMTGVSNVEAAQTTAMIARLASNAGLRGAANVEKLQKAFADLGASRGIAGRDLQDLMGSILSGQDEGLNRLGIADPGQLQAAYAKKIGKTTDALTQQEKVLASLLAIYDKANDNVGAADKRMAGLEGSVVNVSKAWEDLSNTVSSSFLNSDKFQNLLRQITAVLKFVAPAGQSIKEKAAGGEPVTSGDKLAGLIPSFGDTLIGAGQKVVLTRAAGAVGGPIGAAAAGLTSMAVELYDRKVKNDLAALEGENKKIYEAVKQRYGDFVAELTKYNGERKAALDTEIKEETAKNALLVSQQQNYYAVREAQATQFLALNKQQELEQVREVGRLRIEQASAQYQAASEFYQKQIKDLEELASLVDEKGNPIDPEAQKKLDEVRRTSVIELDKLSTQMELNRIDALKQQLELQRQIAEEVKSVITGAAAERNPFVTIFENAYQALKKVASLTKELGADVRDMAIGSVQTQALRAYENAVMGSALGAYNLNAQAQDFRSGINLQALNPQQQRFREARMLRGQLQAIGAFESVPLSPTFEPDVPANQRKAVEAAYAERMRAYETKQAERDRKIIELTQGLNPARLDRETRDLAASAREREAARTADQEREARNLFKSLQGIIGQDGIKVQLGSGEQVVRIVNEAPGSATVTQRPTPGAVSSRYGN